jgi:hypoxia induced protein
MNAITALVMVCALLTAITLFSGISSMAHGGDTDHRMSHVHMFRRVGWQALTVLAMFMAMFSHLR